MSTFDASLVASAIASIVRGELVVVHDEIRPSTGGLLIGSAALAADDTASFFVRRTSGIFYVAIEETRADQLDIPVQVASDQLRAGASNVGVSVDAADGVTTGISGPDRARTARVLADPASHSKDLVRPGHVVVLRADPQGLMARNGPAEASVDLNRMAGLPAAGLVAHLIDARAELLSGSNLRAFCVEYGLPYISMQQIRRYRATTEDLVKHVGSAEIPTVYGSFTAGLFEWRASIALGHDIVVMSRGDLRSREPLLVRLQAECLLSDALGSTACRCGRNLDAALLAIAESGRGAVIYTRTGKAGLGCSAKGSSQGGDHSLVETGVQVLKALGAERVRLLGDVDEAALLRAEGGITVECLGFASAGPPSTVHYLHRPPMMLPEDNARSAR